MSQLGGGREADELSEKGFCALTKDHRPDDDMEKARIEKAGVAKVEAFYVSKGKRRRLCRCRIVVLCCEQGTFFPGFEKFSETNRSSFPKKISPKQAPSAPWIPESSPQINPGPH